MAHLIRRSLRESSSRHSRATCRTAGIALAVCLAAACSSSDVPPRPSQGGPAPFTDVTAASGLRFHHVNGAFGKRFLPETMGSGVGLLDYDNDGRLDIFLVQSDTWPGHEAEPRPTMALWRNIGGLRFEDVSEQTGANVSGYGMGVTAADYDADGDIDIYVTCLGPNILLRNESGRFQDVAAESGVQGETWRLPGGGRQHSWSSSAAWLDYDRDGDIDLFVASYIKWSPQTDLFTSMDGRSKAYTVPTEYPGESCRLYRNEGNGLFSDVTEEAGVFCPEGKALGVALDDINGDGIEDILVSNDTRPNNLFASAPGGKYHDIALEAGIAYDDFGRVLAGMGIDTADESGNGRTVIAIGNFSREAVSLYRRSEGIFFVDAAAPAGLTLATLPALTFGLLFVDLDLDGRLDLLLANGHIEPDIQTVQAEITYSQPMQLFRNMGRGRYAPVHDPADSALHRPIVGRGLAAGDLDGDGDLDLVVTTNNGPAHVLRNDQTTAHHFLGLMLRGDGGNRDALGARVELEAGGLRQRRLVRTGSSYLSQGDLALTFGLGTVDSIDRLEIRWPGGQTTHHDNLEVDHLWLIRRDGTARPVNVSRRPAEKPR